MVIGGVSTLLFNGNPLLRFDGYYVFMDWLEIPNMRDAGQPLCRLSGAALRLRAQPYRQPSHEPSERGWLFVYAILAYVYRIVLSLGIALLIATKLFFIGMLLAILTLVTTLVVPIFKMLGYLFSSPALQHKRRRALMVSGATLAVLVAAVGVLPLPYATVAQGVVWLPGEDEVRAGTAGIVTGFLVGENEPVGGGYAADRDGRCGYRARLAIVDARLRELSLRYEALQFADRVQAAETLQQRDHVEAQRKDLDARQSALVATATTAGRFILGGSRSRQALCPAKGELLGYVIGDADPVVRVVIPQSEVDLVRAAPTGSRCAIPSIRRRRSRRPSRARCRRRRTTCPACRSRRAAAAISPSAMRPTARRSRSKSCSSSISPRRARTGCSPMAPAPMCASTMAPSRFTCACSAPSGRPCCGCSVPSPAPASFALPVLKPYPVLLRPEKKGSTRLPSRCSPG